MSNKSIVFLAIVAIIVLTLTALVYKNNQRLMVNNEHNHYDLYSNGTSDQSTIQNNNQSQMGINNHDYAKNVVKPKDGQPIKKFTLIAQEVKLEVKNGLTISAWTYNGTVPGEEIRVTQGDFVQIELRNTLDVPVTIHWHGYPVNTAMDGVSGLNQDAVMPGETFTYEFSADVSGTYWYHSHQQSSEQVDKGLYGALIVEPKDGVKADRDYTLILDEWMSKPEEGMGSMSSMNMPGMSMSNNLKNDPVQEEEDMMALAYDIYTVNGKSGELIKPLEAKGGEAVRLRFINAGYRTHGIHVPGENIKVVSTDGQDINGAGVIKDQIVMIAPGERYDIEFTIESNESFIIDAHDNNAYNNQLRIPINIQDGNKTIREEDLSLEYKEFDLTNYGTPSKGEFTLEQSYNVDFNVELGTNIVNGLKYTINGNVFDELPALKVKTGDYVKLTYYNNSKINHPMHLHGHFFQVLSKNDMPLTGAPIIKDTLMIKPGEKFVVAFKADNPGRWVQHCHELHHAAGGMMQKIEYTDYTPNYTANPSNINNKPE